MFNVGSWISTAINSRIFNSIFSVSFQMELFTNLEAAQKARSY